MSRESTPREGLTKAQWDVLNMLLLRPNGGVVRGAELKAAALSLSDRQLVCDPHTFGDALFTRITPAGRLALSESQRS